MPAPVVARARPAGSTPKRTKEQQQPPAKRTKLSQTQSSSTPKKGLAAVVVPKGEGKKTSKPISNGLQSDARLHQVDESAAAIRTGGLPEDVDMEDASKQVVEISSAEDSESEYDSSDSETKTHTESSNGASNATASAPSKAPLNGSMNDNEASGDSEDEEETEKEPPSFGELLQAAGAMDEAIDVEAAFDESNANGISKQAITESTRNSALSLPTGANLTTVLTQALRTNDKDLLETCLQMNDLDSVRSTIERLDSTLVAALLKRIAERLHKRPGRAANLMVWVQWTLVSHGGYLVSQPDVVRKVADLYRVISERATGLSALLQLKGKLDMLSAQLALRRSMGRPPEIGADDDEAVIYVEGEESDSDAATSKSAAATISKRKAKKIAKEHGSIVDSDADDGIDMPAIVDSDDEAADSDVELLDDEAEETDRDTGDDLSEGESGDEDEDEEDSFIDDGESIAESEEEEGSEEEAVPVRRSTAVQRPSRKAF